MILTARSLSSPASKSIQSDILEAVWGSYSSLPVPLPVSFPVSLPVPFPVPFPSQGLEAADPEGTGSGMGHDRVQIEGLVCVHGRDMSEWSLKALRERITYMKEGDLDFSLPAGLSVSQLFHCLFSSVCILTVLLLYMKRELNI